MTVRSYKMLRPHCSNLQCTFPGGCCSCIASPDPTQLPVGVGGFLGQQSMPACSWQPCAGALEGKPTPPPSLLHSTFLHWGSTAKYRSLFPSSPPLLSQHRELRKHSGTEHIKGENNNAATNPGSGGERDHSGQALSYATHAP